MFGKFFRRKETIAFEEETQLGAPQKRNYMKFQGMKKLGDRALSAGQYEKAIECYENALYEFIIPNSPQYLAVLESIKKAKNQLSTNSAIVQPKSYVQDGIIKPQIMHIRLYSNKQLPAEEWKEIVLKVLVLSQNDSPQLKETVNLAGENCEAHTSWEYVPYYRSDFKHVASDRATTFFESLVESPNPSLCASFTFDMSLPDQQAQGMMVVIVFGDELV